MVLLNPHILNADFMFNKLLAFFLKPHTTIPASSGQEATPPFQEECKVSILGVIRIHLKNPSPRTLKLVWFFLIIIGAIIILFILRLNSIELKVTPGAKKAVSQLMQING